MVAMILVCVQVAIGNGPRAGLVSHWHAIREPPHGTPHAVIHNCPKLIVGGSKPAQCFCGDTNFFQPEPNRLHAGLAIALAAEEAAKGGNQAKYLIQRWLGRRS